MTVLMQGGSSSKLLMPSLKRDRSSSSTTAALRASTAREQLGGAAWEGIAGRAVAMTQAVAPVSASRRLMLVGAGPSNICSGEVGSIGFLAPIYGTEE